jgi:hypothetical protein
MRQLWSLKFAVAMILGPLLARTVNAQPEYFAKVSAGFWDGVSQPSYGRKEMTDPVLAEVESVVTDAELVTVYPYPDHMPTEVISSGSTVVKARAGGGVLGASVYTGWLVGTDTYYGYAEARTADLISITGGTPNSMATVSITAIVNGGIGIYGSDAGASARAYFRYNGIDGLNSDYELATSNYDELFDDDAYGEERFDDDGVPLPPEHFYDFGIRYDHRLVNVMLDAAGNGSFGAELFLDLETSEAGDENLYNSAAAADYYDTLHLQVQPWSGDFGIESAAGWEVRPFGSVLNNSPEPFVIPPEQLGIVPEPTTFVYLVAGLVVLGYCRGAHLARWYPAR